MKDLGWRGTTCQDTNHQGTVLDRCADCGKRKEK
jgi:hypothetical protein